METRPFLWCSLLGGYEVNQHWNYYDLYLCVSSRRREGVWCPKHFVLLLSCKSYCLGGFVFSSFVACHNDGNLSKRCISALKCSKHEIWLCGYKVDAEKQYGSRQYTETIKNYLDFFFFLGIVTKIISYPLFVWVLIILSANNVVVLL